MLEMRVGERYVLRVEGGAAISGLVCEVSDKHVAIAPPDVVPWGAKLRLALRQVYAAERIWVPPPKPAVDPNLPDWFDGGDWLLWPPGTELEERRPRRRRKSKPKPLFPEEVTS